MSAKFKNREEYIEWCKSTITRIYYCNIAMNGEGIREVVSEIAETLHISEGDELIDQE